MEKYSPKNAPILNPDLPFTARSIFKTDNIHTVYLELEPGMQLDPHRVEFKATFVVLEGNGMCLSGESSTPVHPFDVIRFEPQELRGWENTGNAALKLLVFKEL